MQVARDTGNQRNPTSDMELTSPTTAPMIMQFLALKSVPFLCILAKPPTVLVYNHNQALSLSSIVLLPAFPSLLLSRAVISICCRIPQTLTTLLIIMCDGDPPTMEDDIVVSIEPLVIPATLQSPRDADAQLSSSEDSSSGIAVYSSAVHVVEVGGCDTSDDEHLVQTVECRICQEEDSLDNMDIPCACRGTMKFAHWRCVQLWCNEKGDTICEICHQPYKPSYSPYYPEVASNNIRTCWTISRAPLYLHDPQTLAIAALEHHVLEDEDDDYVYSSISGIAFFRFIGLTIITLLLLRLAALLFNTDVGKALANFSFTLFRAAAFVLPLYLMGRTIRSILTRRQRQLAAPELAFMLHEGQHHGLQFATSPVPAFRL